MERKLAEYRMRKAREQFIEDKKNKLLNLFMLFQSGEKANKEVITRVISTNKIHNLKLHF